MNSLLTDSRASQLHLPDIVGQGYGTFWRFKGRYRVCKGSRASKKSKTTALWYIVNLMKYPQANLLVIRKVYRTLHDSCFTDLKWAISRLGVQAFWDVKESPLELTYKPTGQKILFRGLDDPLKVTSIAAEHGYLCWAWIEEAYSQSPYRNIFFFGRHSTVCKRCRFEYNDSSWKQRLCLSFSKN